jgi:PD-(D/E)XK nuclease superfamily protein
MTGPQNHGVTEINQPPSHEISEINLLTQRIIGCAIEVHGVLGPGLLEAMYESAICVEFDEVNPQYARQGQASRATVELQFASD